MAFNHGGCYRSFLPYLLLVLVQIAYAPLFHITEAAFKHGMHPSVYVTYRCIVGAVVGLPFAYFLERRKRPRLTFPLFMEIFFLSLLGITLTQNMYFSSLHFTSPTFVSSMPNTIPSLTFVIAIASGLEVVNIRHPRGIAKVLGTLVSLAGVLTVTLYKGPVIKNIWHPLITLDGSTFGKIHQDWVKGPILTIGSCITMSLWYIMQSFTLRRYPAQLSLSTWMCFLAGAQSALYAVIVDHRKAAWAIELNIETGSIVYGGVVVSWLVVFLVLWCTEVKGPVFVTMFNPLTTILVTLVSYFVMGEKLYTGSILGGVTVIVGLYLLLWGKAADTTQVNNTTTQVNSTTMEEGSRTM